MLSPARMRLIDHWIGVPLCFLATVFAKVANLGRPNRRRPQNVLFIELAEMGSLVLAAPAVQRLKAMYPGCQVFFLAFQHVSSGVRVLGFSSPSNVWTLDASNLLTLARDTVRFVQHSRRCQIDTVIHLEFFSRFGTLLGLLSGARTRVGFAPFTQRGLYVGHLFTHPVLYNPHIHTSQSFLALVEAVDQHADGEPLGKYPVASPPILGDLCPTSPMHEASTELFYARLTSQWPVVIGKRLVVINPNASSLISIRRWPLERYADLVRRLLDDQRTVCVLIGVASEKEDAAFIRNRISSDRVIDLAGQTTLDELLLLFNIADLLITNDSGPAQFAALSQIDVLVFFGPETPALYRPLTPRCTVMYSNFACSPCVSAFNQRLSPCGHNRCLTTISVETAYEAAAAILTRRDRALDSNARC